MVETVGVSRAELVAYYPLLYHMAEEGTWDCIRQHGLLSTTALLDLYALDGPERVEIESAHRPESRAVTHDVHGTAVFRDQKPLREASLQQCLVGYTPAEWYRVLNGKVFFWVTERRLLNMLSAREYRNRTHCVLTVDTKQLLERHIERISLSPINSGSTLYQPQPRGKFTFLPITEYEFEARKKKRGPADAVAELCVDYSVPDISELVTRVAHMKRTNEVQVLFERQQ
jgi:hypothetical protein